MCKPHLQVHFYITVNIHKYCCLSVSSPDAISIILEWRFLMADSDSEWIKKLKNDAVLKKTRLSGLTVAVGGWRAGSIDRFHLEASWHCVFFTRCQARDLLQHLIVNWAICDFATMIRQWKELFLLRNDSIFILSCYHINVCALLPVGCTVSCTARPYIIPHLH